MSYEMGARPLRQVQLPRLSPVMWSMQTGYPRRQVAVPIQKTTALGLDSELPAALGSALLLLVALPVVFFIGVAGIGILGNVVSGREPFEY